MKGGRRKMLYDPTIFDNLKVAIENELYDRDNIDQLIHISGRKDMMDMAVMEREFRLKFHLVDKPDIQAEIVLHSSLTDLAAEILEQQHIVAGCSLRIHYELVISDEQQQCAAIEQQLQSIWGAQVSITQQISHVYDAESLPDLYHNRISIVFHRKINEEQMNDIMDLAEHMIHSLTIMYDCLE